MRGQVRSPWSVLRASPLITFRLVLASLLLTLFVTTAVLADDFPRLARYFPYYISVAAALHTAVLIVVEATRLVRSPSRRDGAAADAERGDGSALTQGLEGTTRYAMWILGYLGLMYLVGFQAATVSFLGLFFWFETRAGWRFLLLGVGGALAVFWGLSQAFGIVGPPGLIDLGF